MAWQHDGRMLPDGELTFFDDGSNPPIHSQSRGVRLQLDTTHKVARLLFAYTHRNPPLLAASQGNMQTLPNGNALVGYGGVPAISEYARDGSLLLDAHMPFDMSFYRAFRFPWQGRPSTPPAVAASVNNTGEETIVHASWNGATGVAAWRVLAGSAARIAEGRQRDPLAELRELAHAPQALLLRAGPGARRLRSDARELQRRPRGQLRRLAVGARAALQHGPNGPDGIGCTAPVTRDRASPAPSVGRFGGVFLGRGRRRRGRRRGRLLVVVELLFPPQAASTKVLESAARSVSMAVSGNLRIGRAPIVARGLGRPPYQAPPAPPAAQTADMSVETAPTPRAPELPSEGAARSPSSGWLLAVCCVAQFMVILDLSIVNVALPHIQLSLGFSNPALQWVVDAYAITFAGFLILGGRAADHFGQRRTFVLALLLFGAASLFGGLAPNQGVLVGARALQGFAGALMAACSLAIITASFAPGPQLNRAIGIWAAMNGLGGAAGVLLGGIITEFLSWRWVLLINPPIAIAAALVAYAVVTERRGTRGEVPFDLAGAVTLTLGQMVLVFGVVEAGLKGWSTSEALGPIVLGILMLVAFGVIEARIAKAPLIPFKELTQTLKNANTIVLLFSAALFPMWILSTLYLQQVLGLTALDTGLIFLPMTVAIGVVARSAGRLVSALGVREVLGSGLIMMTVGMLLLTRIAPSGSGIVYVMIPGILTAAGIALSIVPSTIAATQGSKEGQAGLASGLVNTSRQVGGGLGLAILITLATQRTSNLIGAGEQVDQALTHGFRLAYLIGAILCGLAALMTFLTLPRGQHSARAGRLMALAVAGVLALFLGLTAAFAGNKGPPLGQYSLERRLQLRVGALAAPAADQNRHPRAGLRARARVHLHDQLLRPQRTADHRPERSSDPRPPAAAGVVPAGARTGGGCEPQPAEPPRQAGAVVVAGQGDQHRRHRKRRRRGRQPALPAGRAPEGHERLGADACTSS